MELIEGSETSAYNNQTPGKYSKEYIQDSKHGESLKSRMKYYTPTGTGNHGRPLKRLMDTSDRNGSTTGRTP